MTTTNAFVKDPNGPTVTFGADKEGFIDMLLVGLMNTLNLGFSSDLYKEHKEKLMMITTASGISVRTERLDRISCIRQILSEMEQEII